MKVINIDSVAVEKNTIIQHLSENNNQCLFVLTDSKYNLKDLESREYIFSFIENLKLDSTYLYNLKVVKQIIFDFSAYLKYKSTGQQIKSVQNLADVYVYLTANKSKADDIRLILDTESKDVLAEVIQQSIYSGIPIDVMLKSEEDDRRTTRIFLDHLELLKERTQHTIGAIESISTEVDISTKTKGNILDRLRRIDSDLQAASGREMIITLLAPRRFGKSVILNCLLGDYYAPTSGDNITVTNYVYEKSPDNVLRIIQKKISERERDGIKYYEEEIVGQPREFSSVSELSTALEEIADKAQLDTENDFSIPEITVQYIANKNLLRNFKIIDTPGPNLADKHSSSSEEAAGAIQSSKHAELAYRWLKKSDVTIFIFKYMHDRDQATINYFRDVKSYFHNQDKFYSLITVLNQLDNIYIGGDNVSTIRALDRLKKVLEDLGYKGFTSLGTIAMSYHYINKVKKLPEFENIDQSDADAFALAIKKARENYQGQRGFIEPVSFLNTLSDRLIDFHGVYEPTLDDLIKQSGLEQLIAYADYIASEKAATEMLKALMGNIDRQIVNIKNEYLIEQLKDYTAEKDEILKLLEILLEDIESIKKKIKITIAFDALRKNINSAIETTIKSVTNIVYDTYESRVVEKIEELASVRYSDLERFEVDDINIEPQTVSSYFKSELKELSSEIEEVIKKEENILKQHENEIVALSEKFSNKLKGDYDINIEINLPRLEGGFVRPSLDNLNLSIDGSIASTAILTAVKREETLIDFGINTLVSWWNDFTGDNYRTDRVSGDYYIDKAQALAKFANKRNEIKLSISHRLQEKVTPILKQHAERFLNKLNEDMEIQVKDIIDDYLSIFRNIKNDLELSQQEIEHKISFLRQVDKSFDNLYTSWIQIK